MKVAMITPVFERCGVAAYARDLIAAIRDYTSVDLYVIRHHRYGLTDKSYFNRLYYRINKIAPDIIHIQHEYSLFRPQESFIDFLFPIKIPTVITMHSVGSPTVDYFLRQVKCVRKIVIPNKFMEAPLRGMPIEVIPHMCPQPKYSYKEARESLGIGDERLIVHLGFIDYRKGTDIFVRLAKKLPGPRYVIVGGWHADVLPDFNVKVLEAAKRVGVHVTGFVPRDEYYKWMCAADIIVQPSRFITESYTVAEALGARKPIVVLDNPIQQDYPVYRAKSEDEIVSIVKKLIEEPKPPSWIDTFVSSRKPKKIARMHEEMYRRC